ncbi:MAG TPA: hypothetical protein VHE61_00405 [Opitutaceae bacterium]|nr:hypothetical protein [Opitutaceae bacterium]
MNSASVREVLVLHHSHTDIGYTHPPIVVWELSRRFINEALDLCEATADRPAGSRVCWTCETTGPLLHWLEHASDRDIARFRRLVKRGQIGAAAMALNITPLYDTEELIRHLEPIGRLKKELGLPFKVAINHDVNGLPWPITDLLLDAGVEMLLMGINVHLGGYPLQRPRGFHWISPSGRPLLTFNAEHYQSFDREARLRENSLAAMAEGLGAYIDGLVQKGYAYDFIYLSATHPTFPDNNPPNPVAAELIRRWNAEGREPKIRYVLPDEIAARLAAQPAEHLPSHAGDWTDFWNFGCGSAAVETKVNRRARRRLVAAETLRSLTAVRPAKTLPGTWGDAWHNVQLHDEHSWGIHATLRTVPPEPINEQWYQKAITAYRASSLAGLLFRDVFEQWAGPAAPETRPSGLMLCNPTPVETTGCVRVPERIIQRDWEFLSSHVLQLELQRDLGTPPDHGTLDAFSTPAPTVLAGPFTLPPFGFKYVRLSELKPAEVPPELTAREGRIESAFYRLDYDPATGRILALHDKARGVNLVEGSSPWSFFGFVREMPDPAVHSHDLPEKGREAYFTTDWVKVHHGISAWNTAWTARRETPARLVEQRTVLTPEGASLLLRWEAPGVQDFQQKITLGAAAPRVVCTASYNKLDVRAAEAIYFTFPLAQRDWRAHFDTAGAPVEFEREQLPGSCRDWVTADSWVCVHDAKGAVTLACPDAPLVQIGGFRFGRGNLSSDRSQPPLLLGWPMNNYWSTNFRASQPGYAQFRYVLTSHATYDPAESARVGLQAQTGIEWQPVADAPAAKSGRLASVRGKGVFLIGAELHRNTRVLHLLNVTSRPAKATVRLAGAAITSATRIDPAGRRLGNLPVGGGALAATVPPRSVLLAAVQTGEAG